MGLASVLIGLNSGQASIAHHTFGQGQYLLVEIGDQKRRDGRRVGWRFYHRGSGAWLRLRNFGLKGSL
jgi:hypothetical protein